MDSDNIIEIKNSKNELNRFIEFGLGSENYAVSLLMVREVISVPETTPIPTSPSHFLGIINLRGQIISVIDLRKKLKIEAKSEKEEVVIIIDIGGVNVGVVVDSINKVLAFSADDVGEMPAVDGQIKTSFICGVYKKDDSLTILLDISKILSSKDMMVIGDSKKAA